MMWALEYNSGMWKINMTLVSMCNFLSIQLWGPTKQELYIEQCYEDIRFVNGY